MCRIPKRRKSEVYLISFIKSFCPIQRIAITQKWAFFSVFWKSTNSHQTYREFHPFQSFKGCLLGWRCGNMLFLTFIRPCLYEYHHKGRGGQKVSDWVVTIFTYAFCKLYSSSTNAKCLKKPNLLHLKLKILLPSPSYYLPNVHWVPDSVLHFIICSWMNFVDCNLKAEIFT